MEEGERGGGSPEGNRPSSSASVVPDDVLDMARDQADHMQSIVEEAQASEERRERQTKVCPDNCRDVMNRRHEREREAEVLKIQRMREEHAFLLNSAMQDDLPEYVPSGRDYGKTKSRKKDVGTTNQELMFLKDIYGKIDGSADLKQQQKARKQAAAMKQRSESSRMSTSRSYGFGPAPQDRRGMLEERKSLLMRLHTLVSVEENMAMQPSGRSQSYRGFSGRSQNLGGYTGRSSGGMMTSRSTTSQASAATFCPPERKYEHSAPVPRNVPPLRMRR